MPMKLPQDSISHNCTARAVLLRKLELQRRLKVGWREIKLFLNKCTELSRNWKILTKWIEHGQTRWVGKSKNWKMSSTSANLSLWNKYSISTQLIHQRNNNSHPKNNNQTNLNNPFHNKSQFCDTSTHSYRQYFLNISFLRHYLSAR